MNFKSDRRRENLAKKAKRGFRGYPAATIAHYGPTDKRASKVVVGIVRTEDAEADPLKKWFSEGGDVRREPEIIEGILRFLEENSVKSVIATDRIIGCPHEEGIDYPEGGWCPECLFWKNHGRFTGEALQ